MVTGENNKKFQDWYFKKYIKCLVIFSELPFEMQIGVYLAYYDSLGICISTYELMYYEAKIRCKHRVYLIMNKKSRNEAYKEAFKKANDLLNKSTRTNQIV